MGYLSACLSVLLVQLSLCINSTDNLNELTELRFVYSCGDA